MSQPALPEIFSYSNQWLINSTSRQGAFLAKSRPKTAAANTSASRSYANRHKSRRHRPSTSLGAKNYLYTYLYGFCQTNPILTRLTPSYERHEGSLAASLTVARTELVGMQFAAGRPILAVIFLDEHRDPFAAHIERFRDCACNGLGKRPLFLDRASPCRAGSVITGMEMT